MKYECVYGWCSKAWTSNPSKRGIITHYFDEHQANLSFLSTKAIYGFVKEVKEVVKT